MKGEKKKRRGGRKFHLINSGMKAPPRADLWSEKLEKSDMVLVIACGALAKEITVLTRLNNWTHIKTRFLPAKLHNEPQKITEQLRKNLINARNKFSQIFVGYADCGTGGQLDSLLDEFGIQRLPGAHCYEFFSGSQSFTDMVEDEPGSFFLTDFLVKSFDKLIWHGLKINSHPELKEMYFKNYKKLVYLGQTENPDLQTQASEIAERLGLTYEYRFTGYGELSTSLSALTATG
ncbi:MAG: hypothetical protein MAG581_00511 [Deltaproteobacteria bacterium]|jgi:hypothetical protein|nr:hypothetical protein [Deltaproteobacteria bacterium]